MLNKKLTSCSPILLQDVEDDEDDLEFEVRRSSSPQGGLFFNNNNDLLFVASSDNSKVVSRSDNNGQIQVPSSWGGGGGGTLTFGNNSSGPSSTVNNAITLAPSRNHTHHDPNVFTGGRPPKKHKRHKGHHNHHHHQRSPLFPQEEKKVEGSILTRIDHSIMSNFGDWNTVEDDPVHHKLSVPPSNNKSRSTHRPYYLPSKGPPEPTDPLHGGGESLPKLYKSYEVVVGGGGGGGSNSPAGGGGGGDILAEAKRTLNAYGVHS